MQTDFILIHDNDKVCLAIWELTTEEWYTITWAIGFGWTWALIVKSLIAFVYLQLLIIYL